MKIYVVTENFEKCSSILGIFKSEKLANNLCNEKERLYREGNNKYYEVEEFKLEEE